MGELSWVVNPSLNLQDEIVAVLKEIGSKEAFVEPVAEVLVGLE